MGKYAKLTSKIKNLKQYDGGFNVEYITENIFIDELFSIRNQFSLFRMVEFVGILPIKEADHSSVNKGFGVWWQTFYIDANGGQIFCDSYEDDRISNIYTASSSYNKYCTISLKSNNLLDYLHDGLGNNFIFNGQQMHRTSSGYEDSGSDVIAGWESFIYGGIDGIKAPYFKVEYELKKPTISDLQLNQTIADNDLILTWKATNNYRTEIWNNGVLIATLGMVNTYVMPKQYISLGENAITVKVINQLDQSKFQYFISDAEISEATIKKTITTLEPKISNVTIQNDGWLIDNSTRFTWQSTNQNKIEIWINDKLKWQGTAQNEYALPSGNFRVGSNKIDIKVIKNAIPGVANSERVDTYTTTKDFTRIMPTISNLKLNGLNRDYNSTITFKSTNANRYELNVNGSITAGQITQDNTTININAGYLLKGKNTITVRAIRDTTWDNVLVDTTIIEQVTQDDPIIYGLEPSNILVNVDKTVKITFATNEFIRSWKLYINDTFRGSGTTSREYNAIVGATKKETNILKLIAEYYPNWNNNEIRTTIREVNFIGYGKPLPPKLDGYTTYNTANPTFTWQDVEKPSDNQEAFEIVVSKNDGTEVERKLLDTEVQQYTIVKGFENNTKYTVKVSIKNKYGIWSDWSAKNFETTFNNLPKPTVKLDRNGNTILVNVDSHQVKLFKEIKIYRKTLIEKDWTCIANNCNSTDSIIDYTVSADVVTQYKCRYYDKNGGYGESDIQETIIKFLGYEFCNVEDFKQSMLIKGGLDIKYGNNTNVVFKMFAGKDKPTSYTGSTKYITASLSISIKRMQFRLLKQLIDDSNIICFRAWDGTKMYCKLILNDWEYDSPSTIRCSVNLTEVNFNENSMYSGSGFRKIVYLDGSYKLDGSVKLDGFDDNYSSRSVMYYE